MTPGPPGGPGRDILGRRRGSSTRTPGIRYRSTARRSEWPPVCAHPKGSAEEMVGVVTCRRADGREVSLESSPSQRLSNAETVPRPEDRALRHRWPARQAPSSVSRRSMPGVAVWKLVVVTLQELDELKQTGAAANRVPDQESATSCRGPVTSIIGSTMQPSCWADSPSTTNSAGRSGGPVCTIIAIIVLD